MYLVSYDIASDKLRAKISKVLEGYGRRVQYSVFECDLTDKRYQELYAKLLILADEIEDGNICFYYLCKTCERKKQIIGVPSKLNNYLKEEIIVI